MNVPVTPDPANDLLMWTVYAYPLDFPNHVVTRLMWIKPGGACYHAPLVCVYGTVEEAMFDCEAKGLTYIGRQPMDEPQIVGVWI